MEISKDKGIFRNFFIDWRLLSNHFAFEEWGLSTKNYFLSVDITNIDSTIFNEVVSNAVFKTGIYQTSGSLL